MADRPLRDAATALAGFLYLGVVFCLLRTCRVPDGLLWQLALGLAQLATFCFALLAGLAALIGLIDHASPGKDDDDDRVGPGR